MREIEFRAKRKDNDEWIYGSLLIDEIQNSYVIVDNQEGIGREVNPETIGQYTGLKDENGQKIFEGNIIDFSYDMFVGNFDTFIAKGKIVLEDGAFYVECLENERTTKEESYLLYSINIDTIEVIGNIYDNPELLEE